MIHVIFHGGLGNQFFQYAFGRALQEIYHDDVEYRFESNIAGDTRVLTIEHFKLDERWHKSKDNTDYWAEHKVRKLITRCIQKLGRQLEKKNNSSEDFGRVYLAETGVLNHLGVFTHYLHRYPPLRKSWTRDICVDGLWNDPKYFIHMQSVIANELTLKMPPKGKAKLVLDNILSNNSVCVHVRRGDYVYVPGYLVCTPHYYEEAISQMKTAVSDPVFFVFSDDFKWCKENIMWPQKTIFVDDNNPDYIDISLMSGCKHFIISNSTFSWWAAFLGKNESKIVYTPDKWYNDGKTKASMYLPEWRVIPTEIPKEEL